MHRHRFVVVLFLGLMSFHGYAATPALSQSRLPGESWQDAFRRYGVPDVNPSSDLLRRDSPLALRTGFEELDVTTVPDWESIEKLTEEFKRVRDLRFLYARRDAQFARRISWLYPDDGCYARAARARSQLEDEWGFSVAKLYIFGNLSVETANHPSGQVDWSWHVVVAARVGDDLYVIDPAIEPSRPLKASEWATRQVADLSDAEFALCDARSYEPRFGSCLESPRSEENPAAADQTHFLEREWKRLEKLERDPVKELGESPPWEISVSASTMKRKAFEFIRHGFSRPQ